MTKLEKQSKPILKKYVCKLAKKKGKTAGVACEARFEKLWTKGYRGFLIKPDGSFKPGHKGI